MQVMDINKHEFLYAHKKEGIQTDGLYQWYNKFVDYLNSNYMKGKPREMQGSYYEVLTGVEKRLYDLIHYLYCGLKDREKIFKEEI